MRKRLILIAAFAGVIGGGTALIAGEGVSPHAYDIVATTAIPVLPAPLRPFFDARIDSVQAYARAGAPGDEAPSIIAGRAADHFVMLDVAARDGYPSARRAAALRFPRERLPAEALYRRHGAGEGGRLPWVILEYDEALVEAFRSGDARAVVRSAGVLMHYATDAALPLNTTIDREGRSAGHVVIAHGNPSDSGEAHRTVRQRFHGALIQNLRGRYEFEVRVAPERFAAVAGPTEAVFDTLLEAHATVETCLEIDAAIMTELGVSGEEELVAAVDAYDARLAKRAASVMETRLEAGALLAAKLIGSAWIRAGRPSPQTWTPRKVSRKSLTTTPNTTAGLFVGSRNSTIFHRASCSHASRIKPTNLISFSSAGDARKAGRNPCKSCRPAKP